MQLLPFLERKDGWGVSSSLLLVETWLKGWGCHSPDLPLPLAYPRKLFEDEEGESLAREREFGLKLWNGDLGEPKASHGPLPPFPLGVPITPVKVYPAL